VVLWNNATERVRNASASKTLTMTTSSRYSSYNCLTSWDSYDRIPRYRSLLLIFKDISFDVENFCNFFYI